MNKLRYLPLMAMGILIFAQASFAATYQIDPDHSTVSFKIRHLVSNVQGRFNQFEGKFDYDPDKPDTWKAEATIQASSIDTNVAPRDKHLRSADFFDVEKYPILNFVSTGVSDVTETNAKLSGNLTLHGVEKPLTLDIEIHGIAKDPWGNVRAAFTATTKINRKDFGLTWNQAVEAGKFLVGEDVTIILEIEGILEEKEAANSGSDSGSSSKQ